MISDGGVSTAPGFAAPSRALRAILTGGLVAGALDITYACIVWALRGVSPIRIGQSITAGLVGREAAVAGGVTTGLLGLGLHFLMTIGMAAVFYAAATRVPLLVKRAVACGLVYGLGLFLFMNFVVLPLSAIGTRGAKGPVALIAAEILVHMFFVGLPIALFTRRALAPR
jgi:hypothetical protein